MDDHDHVADKIEESAPEGVMDIEGVSVYVTESGEKAPTTSAVISRMYNTGRIRPPVTPTDGLTRTTDRPEIIRWYAAKLGEYVHEEIAGRLGDDYQSDGDEVLERVRGCVGVDADMDTVRATLHDYRGKGSNLRLDLADQVRDEADKILDKWETWWQRRSGWHDVIAVEQRIVADFEWNGFSARVGLRPDLVAAYMGNYRTISWKVTSRLTDAHVCQSAAACRLTPFATDGVVVRLSPDEVATRDSSDEPPHEYFEDFRTYRKTAFEMYKALN